MSVTQIRFLEQDAYQLENDRFVALVVPAFGSNLLSLVEKESGREILRTPQSIKQYKARPMLFGNPVLFPPNRIEDGRFIFAGKTYQFDINRPKENNHIHGFVHQVPWDVVESKERGNSLVTAFRAEKHPDVLRQFPHPFVLRLNTQITETGMRQELQVQNAGNELFPFGIGFHTTFRFDPTDRFAFDPEKEWILNERSLPTGELANVSNRNEWNHGKSLIGITLDTPFLARTNDAWIYTQNLKIRYTMSNLYKHWIIFNGKGNENFLCVEPYSWITNAPNLSLPEAVTGLQVLHPGEQKTFVTDISIH